MGEGEKEEVLVSSAIGGGQDGSSAVSPSGSGEGRYFAIPNAPLASGRTEVFVTKNGVETSLFGIQQSLNSSSTFDSKYDFRLDITKGHLELQKASILDQNGKLYSTGSSSTSGGAIYGNGTLVTGDYSAFSLLQLQDDSLDL